MIINEKAPVQTVPETKHVCTLPAEEVARLKGLGCLWDKRTDDAFNVRVITVNGKVTAETLETVAEASRTFGSGQVTMTSRMTLEIQGVPYANVEPMREFLAGHGLERKGPGGPLWQTCGHH